MTFPASRRISLLSRRSAEHRFSNNKSIVIGFLSFVVFLLFLLTKGPSENPDTATASATTSTTVTTTTTTTLPQKILQRLEKSAAPVSTTGSFLNCTTLVNEKIPPSLPSNEYDGSVIISCQSFPYKLHAQEMRRRNDADAKYPVIAFVVLSTIQPRRAGIRQTWKLLKPQHVFFIVTGPFDAIREEYELEKDILWIDTSSDANPNANDSTIKLLFAYHAIHKHMSGYKLIVHTNDDTFVNITKFAEATQLFNRQVGRHDYLDQNMHLWGTCATERSTVVTRSIPDYPFQHLPPYCYGAGTMITRIFASCAVQELATLQHIKGRPEIATAMLAERCHVIPTQADTGMILSAGEPIQQPNDYWIQQGFFSSRSMIQRWNGTDVGSNISNFLERKVV